MSDPVTLLAECLAALESGDQLPADVRVWLLAGLSGYVSDGGRLEVALGLTSRGTSARRALRRAQRDAHLMRAAALIDAPNPWQRAERLAAHYQIFIDTIWDPTTPPTSGLYRHLWRAQKCCVGIPASVRQLHDLLKENPAFDRSDEPTESA